MNKKSIEIRVCLGTSGKASGGEDVLMAFKQHLNRVDLITELGQRCKIKGVGCRGFCSKDVLVDIVIDEKKTTYQAVTPHMVERIIEEHIINGKEIVEWTVNQDYQAFHNKQLKIVLEPCGQIDPESIEDYLNMNGYKSARRAITRMTPDEIIKKIIRSGLRGRGGGGFFNRKKMGNMQTTKSLSQIYNLQCRRG